MSIGRKRGREGGNARPQLRNNKQNTYRYETSFSIVDGGGEFILFIVAFVLMSFARLPLLKKGFAPASGRICRRKKSSCEKGRRRRRSRDPMVIGSVGPAANGKLYFFLDERSPTKQREAHCVVVSSSCVALSRALKRFKEIYAKIANRKRDSWHKYNRGG